KGIYYSSSAFEVLAAIVEKVSGMEFGEYCKKNIFEPAGMKNTYYTMDTATYFSRGARPYRWVGTEKYYEYPLNYIQAGGAGGWISCVEDFYHFAWALMNKKLLSEKYLDLMMTAHIEMPPKNYGYALEIYNDWMVPGKTVYGHNGGGMGFSCDLFFEPETQTIVATMLNMYGNSRFVTRNFMATTLGMEAQKPETDKRIALFDLIDKKGLNDFSENYANYFKNIGMKQPSPFFLISMADGYEMLGQSETREKYLNILQKVIPDNAVLYIQLGDIEVKKQQKEKARLNYLKALELAEKNEPQWLGEINLKLESL
ncbi:MAG: serine hydrolase, partial [Prolixibacteraceae bacterium]|nr:serine hydrolase [Prolixibacteraceae bacterium]